ncbi:YfbU family protein [Prosthecodimorpha hirschii]|uniref:YfbU family protein n=1 Tax=Prosthecodimorpha hirschii TaxID=665126 RepID=UPI0015E2B786|nr:YfbU family protein [Prosthecomicrobium hirschii]
MKTERVELRLDEVTLERLDKWCDAQPNHPSRSEGIRRLIAQGIEGNDKWNFHPNEPEKLMIWMLSEIMRRTNSTDEKTLDIINSAMSGGHYWSLRWELSGVFDAIPDKDDDLRFVIDTMNMWSMIEDGFKRSSDADRKFIVLSCPNKSLVFDGFDANTEGKHYSIAQFLVKTLGRWEEFKDRKMNSHIPRVSRYCSMLGAFKPIRDAFLHRGTPIGKNEIIAVLNAL